MSVLHICFGFTGINRYVKPKIKTKQIATVGPKHRIGKMKENIIINEGNRLILDKNKQWDVFLL